MNPAYGVTPTSAEGRSNPSQTCGSVTCTTETNPAYGVASTSAEEKQPTSMPLSSEAEDCEYYDYIMKQ